ncbi:MAG: hypothetical protein OHK0046_47720 [Anaerolineae bacterium]
MARQTSKAKMGYYPIDPSYYPAILSLVAPPPGTRMIDPFAGAGEFLDAAAKAWNVTPYANELDDDLAAACIERFGPKQAVQGDAEKLSASNEAFGIAWLNPPYDTDSQTDAKRIEYYFLRHSWKWVQPGGLAFWVVYDKHLTDRATEFFSRYASHAEVWYLPGKDFGKYQQIIVVAIKGKAEDSEALKASIQHQKAHPRYLTVQAEPLFNVPQPARVANFHFTPETIDPEQASRLIEQYGAAKTSAFQELLTPPEPRGYDDPIVPPRPGHMAFVLAGNAMSGTILPTDEYGRVAFRSIVDRVQDISLISPGDEESKILLREKPRTRMLLITPDAKAVEMEGDTSLLNFIKNNRQALLGHLKDRFHPLYKFDYAGAGEFLSRIKLGGKHALYTAQKHVIGAVLTGLQHRKGVLLIGQMGVGKTIIGSSSAMLIGAYTVQRGLTVVVSPPHLAKKWERELLTVRPDAYVRQVKRHEEFKAIVEHRTRAPKVAIIKRDMTKLGVGFKPAVIWRKTGRARWHPDAGRPDGVDGPRVQKFTAPYCPHCGSMITNEDGSGPAAASHFEKRRQCDTCRAPLWYEHQKPAKSSDYKSPRYRLDKYIKKMYPDAIDLLIWDEVHEAANADTGNGEAFSRMAALSKRVLAMTGTPFNGRASSMFNLEYAINPRVRQNYPWGGAYRVLRKPRGKERVVRWPAHPGHHGRGDAEALWVADMGVREKLMDENPNFDPASGKYTDTSTYQRPYQEAPGISPLLVAEILDHSVFFSLEDLGKYLPKYEELGWPVPPGGTLGGIYDDVNQRLQDYLLACRYEGDGTFMGSLLQWAMSWINTPHLKYDVWHRRKANRRRGKMEKIVRTIDALDADQTFPKEDDLIKLVEEEFADNRPVVVFVRDTVKRDLQPRLKKLLEQNVTGAKVFILSNKVEASKREEVINTQIKKGVNVLITNPELVKTGLDLLHFPTLIFFQITYNLSTMMQAAARAYRLNQTHKLCKVIYMFYEGTMEHAAVQLMSRKQRAAKLLVGEIGLTGFDALTEDEGNFEAELMQAIASTEGLVDPAEMFKLDAGQRDIAQIDAAFWEVGESADVAVETINIQGVLDEIAPDEETLPLESIPKRRAVDISQESKDIVRIVYPYLDRVLTNTEAGWRRKLLNVIERGEVSNDDVRLIVGLRDPDYAEFPVHEEKLLRWVRSYVRWSRVDDQEDVGAEILNLMKRALGMAQTQQTLRRDRVVKENLETGERITQLSLF